jgi:hypothetical protein
MVCAAVGYGPGLSSFVSAETLRGLRENLNQAIKILQQTDGPVTSIASGCDLFVRFITLTSLDHPVSISI